MIQDQIAFTQNEISQPAAERPALVRSGSLSTIGSDRWNRFVLRHPLGCLYHDARWHRAIEKSYGYPAHYHVILSQDGEICAGVVSATIRNLFLGRRLVSFPYSDYCDPLATDDRDLDSLLNAVGETAREESVGQVELRAFRNQLLRQDERPAALLNFTLDLNRRPGKIFDGFHKSCVQRAILKAEKSRLQAVEGRDEHDLYHFYRLHVRTRHRQGVPVQPFSFFQNLWREFEPDGAVSLLMAKKADRPVAAILLFKFKDTVYYKFGASDDRALSDRPNHLLFWTGIREAIREGYALFDFGRTSQTHRGLIDFKRRWGTESESLHYICLNDSGQNFESIEGKRFVKIGGKVLKLLPQIVTRQCGKLLYKFLG